MGQNDTVTLEFTDDELALALMCLTLARNSPTMNETNVNDLIEKFAAHVDETAVPAADDCFEDR